MDKLFNLVKKEIDKNIINKHLFIIAIDGDCASGKTTLANLIAKHYSANIIHMDDFFPTNTNEKDDNIDYTRFKKEVIDSLGNDISYRVYDCKQKKFTKIITLKNYNFLIIEGSYSMHPYFNKYYDLSIFLTISEKEQEKRIKTRNLTNFNDFFLKWIPKEKKYFAKYLIKEKAKLTFNTDLCIVHNTTN